MSDVAEKIIAGVKPHLKPDASIGGTIKVDMGEHGVIFFDAAAAPPEMTMEDRDADVTMICSADTFAKMMQGELDGMQAFIAGKLKLKGNVAIARKLSSLFDRS